MGGELKWKRKWWGWLQRGTTSSLFSTIFYFKKIFQKKIKSDCNFISLF